MKPNATLVRRLRTQSVVMGGYRNKELVEWSAAEKIERLERLLEERDAFIVQNNLWPVFVKKVGAS